MLFILSNCNTGQCQTASVCVQSILPLEFVTVVKHRQLMKIITPKDYDVASQNMQTFHYLLPFPVVCKHRNQIARSQCTYFLQKLLPAGLTPENSVAHRLNSAQVMQRHTTFAALLDSNGSVSHPMR